MKSLKLRFVQLTMLGLLAAPFAHAEDAETLYRETGCKACHAIDKKLMGPAYKDVAAKYKGQAGAAEELFKKVRAGGSGVWGTVPMPPNPPERITDEELKIVIDWVLSH